jgi:4-diphosphocytidyl-2-C-methyl-D-erythritol kinase
MMPMQLSVSSPAKLNLSFDIIGQDTNGYHQLVTLFQAIDLQDKLTFAIEQAKENTVLLLLGSTGDQSTPLPLDDSNLINKAIKLFLSRLFQSAPVKITVTIEKNIPIEAGLGGGSSNAAATLLALNHYFSKSFIDISLLEMAAELGSDVAFCLRGGLAIGRGYGEKLQKLSSSLPGYFVLIKPKSISISTPWAFSIFDQSVGLCYTSEDEAEAKLKELISRLNGRTPYPIPEGAQRSEHFWNCFEPIIFKEFPVLAQIRQSLLDLGCLEAHLTGSGPTIYGLVEKKEIAEQVLKSILSMHEYNQPGIMIQAWLAKSINHGAKILLEGSYEGQTKYQTIASS